ncbi:hypothetical protein CCUS01_03905 [Colletotrichum cuscutae]|uniref:Uncharacterized protein n=1 Tax=Colletotrichum cuscutae TaxID=1209917 RepID=A0AAI9VGT2_9PEZI|nr:hypothetical protein CCUS01_03905 [Colletotrichum cuscutae]
MTSAALYQSLPENETNASAAKAGESGIAQAVSPVSYSRRRPVPDRLISPVQPDFTGSYIPKGTSHANLTMPPKPEHLGFHRRPLLEWEHLSVPTVASRV